ncbi:unnamed protein product [Symbiodinium sp. CCMP2592]|nr:unnamed protein product [Symbiodinium sp. CCMP2592]
MSTNVGLQPCCSHALRALHDMLPCGNGSLGSGGVVSISSSRSCSNFFHVISAVSSSASLAIYGPMEADYSDDVGTRRNFLHSCYERVEAACAGQPLAEVYTRIICSGHWRNDYYSGGDEGQRV